jgi:hypothetical protein
MTLTTHGVDTITESNQPNARNNTNANNTGGGGTGLVPGHAYTLIAVKEYNNLRLCKIRNPWGQVTYNITIYSIYIYIYIYISFYLLIYYVK